MRRVQELALGRQVTLIFGSLCAVLLLVGGVSYFGLRAIERRNQVQQSRALDKLALIDDTAQDVGQMQAGILQEVMASDVGEIRKLDETVRALEQTNLRELTAYQAFTDTATERRLYDRVREAQKKYWEESQPVLELGWSNRDTQAVALINSIQAPAYDEYLLATGALIKDVETEANAAAAASTRFLSQIRVVGDVLIGITMLIALGAGFTVARVGRQLKEDNHRLEAEIRERKQAEEELSWKTAFLEAQVNSSIDGILVVNEEGKKTLQNQQVADLLKIPPHIAADQNDRQQLQWVTETTKDPAQFFAKVHYLNTHRDEISRDEVELKDGTVLDRYSSPVVGKDKKYYGRIWTFRNITERKHLEAQLVQSQKMEVAGKLAGGVAHEFNSILTAIIGQSELLLRDLAPSSPLVHNATEITKAATRAAALTRQLLAYGRKQVLRPEVLDLNTILSGMESTLSHLLGPDTVVRLLTATELKRVKVDAGQIEQVIMNMAINARDAMVHGGTFTLETSNVSLAEGTADRPRELKPGAYVKLAISDTGSGMTAAVRARLFEPFFSTKGVGRGTGLGLATSSGIVQQSGGQISVDSEVGRGTTFKIYFPQIESAAAVVVERRDSPDLPRGHETVLLVEEDPALREMATGLLRRLGYLVLAASNGSEALRLQSAGLGPVDLLFTDVAMREMGGKELSQWVRARHPQAKILFASAHGAAGAMEPGVQFLQKPFTPSALARKLRESLDQPDGQPARPVPEASS